MEQAFRVTAVDDGVRFAVRVQPRARKTQVSGVLGEAVKVRVAAPPVEGAANRALVAFLAKRLSVRKSAVHIVGGQTARSKVIEVDGVTPDHVTVALLA